MGRVCPSQFGQCNGGGGVTLRNGEGMPFSSWLKFKRTNDQSTTKPGDATPQIPHAIKSFYHRAATRIDTHALGGYGRERSPTRRSRVEHRHVVGSIFAMRSLLALCSIVDRQMDYRFGCCLDTDTHSGGLPPT
jgi:hypothetical protein